MVDVKLVTNKVLVRDDQNDKSHTILDTGGTALQVDTVLWVDIVEREEKAIHQGGQNSTNRLYEITMAYTAGTGPDEEVTAEILKVTTDTATTSVERGEFNNFRVNMIGMSALQTSYSNSNVTYNLFFWSHGADDGTLFKVHSQRVPITMGEDNESDITLVDGVTTFEYSKTVKMQAAELVDTFDVFTVGNMV